ncbi:MAG: hypothetical protein JSR62_18115 [Nitrospira sp.]|nr:hypothetical protein [Nitrospira sp.]
MPVDHDMTDQTDARLLWLSAFLVVGAGTLVLDASRLTLLVIPLSFLMAAHGAGLCVEHLCGPLLPPATHSFANLILATRIAVGIAILGLVTSLLAMAGHYPWAGILTIGFGIYAIIYAVRRIRPLAWTKSSMLTVASGLVMGGVWLTAWLWATIPPVFYDELVYHLPIPQYALRTGSLPGFRWSYFTLMPSVSDLLLGWGLFFQDDLGARATHWASWIALWMAVAAFADHAVFPRRVPWLGLALACTLGSSATVLFLGTLPFAETVLSLAVIGAGALLLGPRSERAPWLAVGLLWGLAATVKLSGPMWILAETGAALALGWPYRHLVLAWLVTIVTALPWWGRAWLLTGDPVYPLGYRLFGGSNWSEAEQAKLQGDLPSLGSHPTLMDVLRLPYDMVAAPERFGSASNAGVLAVSGICLALLLPLVTYGRTTDQTTRRQSLAGCLFVMIAGAGWMSTSTTTRFFAPALLFGLLLFPILLVHVRPSLQVAGLVGLALGGIAGLTGFLAEHVQSFHSQDVALGREAPGTYLDRTLDHAESARYVRTQLSSDARLLFIGETRPYYFDRHALAPYPFHEHPLADWVREASSSEQLCDRIRAEGITHVVLNIREFKRLHDTYRIFDFSGPQEDVLALRLKELPRLLTLLFSKNGVYVYEIPPDRVSASGH